MSLATLHRGTLLLAAVALTMLTGCAWGPGALCLDPFIHHRNYRAAKVAWMTFGHADLGPWAPLCKDFETGWRQGYYDVAGGMDGQRPITPPRRYWAARYQTPAGEKQVEAWFAGYELGAAAAQRDGIGYWSFVPTSLGAPPQEPIEEHGTVGYRVMPEERPNSSITGRGAPYAEPVPAATPEPIPPRRIPPELPTPAAPPTRREAPRPAPESTEPPSETPPPAVEAPPPAVDESPAPSEPTTPESTDDPFAAPADETPTTEAETPDAPAREEDDEENMDVFEPPAEPAAETPAEEPALDEAAPADTPEADAKTPPRGQPIDREPPDPGTGAPVIPRRDINWPPRPSRPRQPGQQAPAEGALPKGLDTDEPLPDVNDGAAVMRRPRAMRASSIKTLATRTGSNRLRLAPAAPVATSEAPAATGGDSVVTTVAAEEPLNWSPRIEPALHTAPSEFAAPQTTSSESTATAAPAAGEVDEADEQAVIEGLRAFSAAPAATEEAAADESATAAAPSEDDLFSGLSALEESSGDE
ncbi:MAG: hypothetical protein U0836_05315 [Pirellulales bacterium]